MLDMTQFLRGAFETDFDIENPYVLKTKREVIEPIGPSSRRSFPFQTAVGRVHVCCRVKLTVANVFRVSFGGLPLKRHLSLI